MDIVRVKYLMNGVECVIDFTSNDYDCHTSMVPDSELIILTMQKWKQHERVAPSDELISVEIVAR